MAELDLKIEELKKLTKESISFNTIEKEMIIAHIPKLDEGAISKAITALKNEKAELIKIRNKSKAHANAIKKYAQVKSMELKKKSNKIVKDEEGKQSEKEYKSAEELLNNI